MFIDVIILSNAYTPELEALTRKSLKSLIASDVNVKPLIIEQNPSVVYEVDYIHKSEPFNYNKFMNFGIKNTKCHWIAMCNNDLIYKPNWATNLVDMMYRHRLLSASPIDPIHQTSKYGGELDFGYKINGQFNGWCLMAKRELFDIIGELNEDYPFWWADNSFAAQLQEKGIKHARVSSSKVIHLGKHTLKTLPQEERDRITTKQIFTGI